MKEALDRPGSCRAQVDQDMSIGSCRIGACQSGHVNRGMSIGHVKSFPGQQLVTGQGCDTVTTLGSHLTPGHPSAKTKF